MKNAQKRIILQLFADLDTVLTTHADQFTEEDGDVKGSFSKLSEKLSGLGYEVLINQKDKAEFIPGHRLGEVVAQRENYRKALDEANAQLTTLKNTAGVTPEVKAQIDTLLGENENLIAELEKANVQMEIMSAASDAVNPKDILAFVDMSKVKTDKKGNVVSGITEEVTRLRTEKPYLFNKQETKPAKAGVDDPGDGGGQPPQKSMNAAIRRAAGHAGTIY